MVGKLKKIFSREITGLHEAAYLLAFFSVISQLFALIRDRLLASYFGTGVELDIYYAAFKLPDLVFVVVCSLVSISVLVPQFVKYLDNKEKLKNIVDSIFTVLIFISIILLFLSFIFTPYFLKLIVPNLIDSDLGWKLIIVTRILLIQPVILAMSGFMSSLVQAYRRFTVYAFAPITYNLGIIIGIIFFYPNYGLVGLAYGVILGAFLHLFIQVPFIFGQDIYPKLTLKIKYKEIYYIVSNSLPRTASMLSNQAILIFMTFLASTMSYGSLSTFNLSYNLQSVPLAIIGVSYSLAAFPSLSKFYQSGEMTKFFENINKVIRHIIFWSLPIMALFIVLRAQIVRVILGGGNFDWNDTRIVAASLAIFTVSILAQSISLLFLRAYYSMGKTLKPFLITTLLFLSVLVSSFYFLIFVNSSFAPILKEILRLSEISDISVLSLAMAFSFGQIIYTILLIVFFGNIKKIINREIFTTTIHSFIASIFIFIFAFVSLNIFDGIFNLNKFWGVFLQGFLSGIIGIFAGSVFLFFINNREIKVVIKTVKHKFWKTKPISPEVEEEL